MRRKGEAVPAEPFDSNCITPGTEFMARLGKHLRFFIRRKMAEDPLWQKPNVVFSGGTCRPGFPLACASNPAWDGLSGSPAHMPSPARAPHAFRLPDNAATCSRRAAHSCPAAPRPGHEVPGEGEHKIMEYIRWEKRQASRAGP